MTWNTLDVPLETGWQCTLIPGPQYGDLMRWKRGYHDMSARGLYPNAGRDHSAWSWNARPLSEVDKSELWERDRLQQLADDRTAFGRHWRPNWDLRSIVGQKALRDVQAFVRDQLNVAHWNQPTDNAGVRTLLLDAVVSGHLVPVVNREYRGAPRVALPNAAPQTWAAATGSGGNNAYPPKVITYSEFRALQRANGELPGIASIARGGAAIKASDDSDWLGVAKSTAEASLDDDDDTQNLAESMADDQAVNDLSDRSTPLGNVQPFSYDEGEFAASEGDIQTAWLPSVGGPPSQWVENSSGKQQWRLYDANGNAAVDIDFGHDHGFGVPHAHNWDNGVRDNGNAFSLLPN